MFEKALKDWLLTDATIGPQISGVHNSRRPQSDVGLVQIVLSKLGGGHFADLPGEGNCSQPIIQIEAVSDTNTAPTKCKELLETIRNKLCGDGAHRGSMGNPPTYNLVSANTERDYDSFPTPPADGSDDWVFSPSIDLRFTIVKI